MILRWETESDSEIISYIPMKAEIRTYYIIPNPHNTQFTIQFNGVAYFDGEIVDSINEVAVLFPNSETTVTIPLTSTESFLENTRGEWSYSVTVSTEFLGLFPISVSRELDHL